MVDRQGSFIKPYKVLGKSAVFRDATPDDAGFILSLRTDPTKGRHLSATSSGIEQQIAWLNRYAVDTTQVYFVIEDHAGKPVGTVRLYDQQGNSFCWGSWILVAGSPNNLSIESALMVYEFAFELGFERAHFDVRRANVSVWQFHERFGAVRVVETDLDIYYQIERSAIERSIQRYRKFLPNGIQVIRT